MHRECSSWRELSPTVPVWRSTALRRWLAKAMTLHLPSGQGQGNSGSDEGAGRHAHQSFAGHHSGREQQSWATLLLLTEPSAQQGADENRYAQTEGQIQPN